MSLTIVVTLGPSIMDEALLRRIAAVAPCIFRINGAHVQEMAEAHRQIAFVRASLGDPKILIDLPGNKIRVTGIGESITLVAGKTFQLFCDQFNYKDFYRGLKPGQIILANDSIFRFEVVRADAKHIELLSHSDGTLTNNKGMHAVGLTDSLPFLFERDLELIDVAVSEGVHALGLSFVRDASDIALARARARKVKLFSKVEKLAAVRNLDEILEAVDTIIVDRGDLSSETGMLDLPYYQNLIISKALAKGRDVILATQFLKNMETKPVPIIPEVIDLFNTFRLGISGVQLSEETAIGRYPEECVRLVADMHRVALRENEPQVV